MTSQAPISTTLLPRLAGLGLLGLAGACGHGGNGTVIDPSQPTLVVQDAEPNNDPATAQGLGLIGPFEQWRIEGFVDDPYGPYVDEVDGYAFAAAGPIEVDFALLGEQFYSWDIDLGLFDPFLEQWIFTWATYDQDEFGSFAVDTAGDEFHMVVIAALGHGDYRLDMNVLPGSFGLSKDAGSGASEADSAEADQKDELPAAFAEYRAAAERARNLERNGVPVGYLIEMDADGEVTVAQVDARPSGLTLRTLD